MRKNNKKPIVKDGVTFLYACIQFNLGGSHKRVAERLFGDRILSESEWENLFRENKLIL